MMLRFPSAAVTKPSNKFPLSVEPEGLSPCSYSLSFGLINPVHIFIPYSCKPYSIYLFSMISGPCLNLPSSLITWDIPNLVCATLYKYSGIPI